MGQLIEMGTSRPLEPSLAYHILRYVPNLVRDEWVNIGVLVFNPRTGERRLRLIEEQVEYNRVRRLHPTVDETVLRALRDDLEDRLDPQPDDGPAISLQKILRKDDQSPSTTRSTRLCSHPLAIASTKTVTLSISDKRQTNAKTPHTTPEPAAGTASPPPRANARNVFVKAPPRKVDIRQSAAP